METTRKKIGFKFYNEQETETTEVENLNPLVHINTIEQTVETTVNVTPAHKEVLERLEMVKSTIKGKKFTTFTDEKKMEFLNEFSWLTELNAQLTFSY